MDTILTFSDFRSLYNKSKANYKHFDRLYKTNVSEYNKLRLSLNSAKRYIKEHKGEEKNQIYQMCKKDVERHPKELKFEQEEIQMYKREMQRWRDISMRVEKAYWGLYKEMKEIYEDFGRFVDTGKKIHIKRYDTKIHLVIMGYTQTGCHHHVIVTVPEVARLAEKVFVF